MKLTSLTSEQVAEVLSKADPERPVTEADVRCDVENGAPVNEDGTLDFIRYTAYFMKKWKDDEE